MLAVLTLAACVEFTGCANGYSGNCTTQSTVHAGDSKGSSNFSLSTPSGGFQMYPGQTASVPMTIAPRGTSTGSVTITASGLPSGVSLQPVTASIGSSVNLQFVSTAALGSECFLGQTQIYTAFSTIALHASDDTGAVAYGMDLDMVLENPAFVPAAATIPTLDLEVDGKSPIVSKDDYVTGTVTIVDPKNKKNDYTGTMQVKGHGNTTWVMPKKPYRLKLDSKSGLLGMSSEKNWILLANYSDKSMLRDALASEISDITGLPWAPASQYVELTLNGQYQGTYQLIENVDINKSRINIADSDTDTDTPDANGYLLEIDQREEDTYHWITPHGLFIGSEDPDPPTTNQGLYIYDQVNGAEASFYTPNFMGGHAAWQQKWDESSLVDWFLVNELMGNQDSIAYSSDYFYKDAGASSLFFMGPVWDFDVSSGNDNYGDIQNPAVPWVRTRHPWYAQLFTDPEFVQAVKARWAAIRPQVDTLPAFIDTNAAALNKAAANNYGRWPSLYQRVWPNPLAAGTYQGEVDRLKSWLASRVAYMDGVYLK